MGAQCSCCSKLVESENQQNNMEQAPLKLSDAPCMILYPNFINKQECQDLIAVASPLLKPSRVVGAAFSQDRLSSSMFFTGEIASHPHVKALEEKIAALAINAASMQGRSALYLKEATQVVRYNKGEFYGLHRDNSEVLSDSAPASETSPAWRPRRTATVIVYLNTVKAGGETFFPYAEAAAAPSSLSSYFSSSSSRLSNRLSSEDILAKHGVEIVPNGGVAVHPREGYALLFWSVLPDGTDDELAAHSAEPVWMGDKWIATRWCFEAP